MQVVLVYLQPFKRHSLLKYVSQANIAKKINKTFFWCARSSTKVIAFGVNRKRVYDINYYSNCRTNMKILQKCFRPSYTYAKNKLQSTSTF